MMRVYITCWSNDGGSIDCYKRELAKFKDGNSELDKEPAISKAISWLDDLLSAVKNFELIDELEKLRRKLNQGKSPEPFHSYVDIPIEIIGLILKEFNLMIDVHEEEDINDKERSDCYLT